MAEILNRKGKVMSKLARRLFKKAIKNDFRLRQLSLLSAAFDDLQEEKILEVAPFSQIQASESRGWHCDLTYPKAPYAIMGSSYKIGKKASGTRFDLGRDTTTLAN